MPAAPEDQHILITVTGPDHPGVTEALMGQLAAAGARLVDIEQVVVQGQLVLTLTIEHPAGSGEPLLKDLLFEARRQGLDLQFKAIPPPSAAPPRPLYALTAIADPLDASCLHALAEVLHAYEANIDEIRRLSAEDLGCVEITLSLEAGEVAAAALRSSLLKLASHTPMDLALQPERLSRRAKRLVVMDMDSTLIQIEVIDELARMHGVVDKVAGITARAMAGELDFEESLRARVGLLRGLPFERALELAGRLPLTPGARELIQVLRLLGYRTAVISGGFTFGAEALKAELGLDYAFANVLEVEGGVLTGGLIGDIVDAEAKARLLTEIAAQEGVLLEQTIAIGDGANDLPMLERAGLGIAFHAKPKVRAAADTALSGGGLDRILYLLGLHGRDQRALLERAAGRGA